MTTSEIQIDSLAKSAYRDVYTDEVMSALSSLSPYNSRIKDMMRVRMEKRLKRQQEKKRITFLDPLSRIGSNRILVQDARNGKFEGPIIPEDLQRQWIQGTGPACKPNTAIENSLRNVAYALLSGADGWMFDGEDALGQINTMSLDNQRNLMIAYRKDEVFLKVAQTISQEMNRWSESFLGYKIIKNWQDQLSFTTKIFRPRGLHLDDRHIYDENGVAMSACLVDTILYVTNNYKILLSEKSSLVLYLPKIQTAEEAALLNEIISALEQLLKLDIGTIKVYVLIEQIEASFQLMEIRAALAKHFIGFNTGRWDYINSVIDAMSWDNNFINPNIDEITMTYGYMHTYEDRVRKAANIPDINGNSSLWQGGMEANIPVGSEKGVSKSMEKAITGAQREEREGASGKWVAHWKMVHIIRPVWEKSGNKNQLGRTFPPLTYTQKDADDLLLIEKADRTISGFRNMISVALQYGNAFGQGLQAVAIKPADNFGNENILYLMEDMATAEIRLSILWEWIHKGATLTKSDDQKKYKIGEQLSLEIFDDILIEEYKKLKTANDTDVHKESKETTLPICKEAMKAYVSTNVKLPWFIDLLNINLNNSILNLSQSRIKSYINTFNTQGIRITNNLDFTPC